MVKSYLLNIWHNPLTPRHQAELEHIFLDVDVKDSDEEQVEMEPFQSHPDEGGQQGPV